MYMESQSIHIRRNIFRDLRIRQRYTKLFLMEKSIM